MTTVQFRNTETRLSEALAGTARAVQGHAITLRELIGIIGEQGLLILCILLAAPSLLPVTPPLMSAALALPLLLIAIAVTANRLPLLPDRLLDRELPAATVQRTIERVSRLARSIEHLIRPRLLGLSGSPQVNALNGAMLVLAALLLLAPLPLVPLAGTLPAIAIMLLALGMAERDGLVILLGYAMTVIATAYVVVLTSLLVFMAANAGAALAALLRLFR
ncbi:MAG TPA: exopolysaccharide biosynthesis protein [Gammaproteobacteria bacterium]